jgi:hypothetical protein
MILGKPPDQGRKGLNAAERSERLDDPGEHPGLRQFQQQREDALVLNPDQRARRRVDDRLLSRPIDRIGDVAWRSEKRDQHVVRAERGERLDGAAARLIETARFAFEQQGAQRWDRPGPAGSDLDHAEIAFVQRFEPLDGVLDIVGKRQSQKCRHGAAPPAKLSRNSRNDAAARRNRTSSSPACSACWCLLRAAASIAPRVAPIVPARRSSNQSANR